MQGTVISTVSFPTASNGMGRWNLYSLCQRHRSQSLPSVLEKPPSPPTLAPSAVPFKPTCEWLPVIPQGGPLIRPLRKLPSVCTFPDTEHQNMVNEVKTALSHFNHPYEEPPVSLVLLMRRGSRRTSPRFSTTLTRCFVRDGLRPRNVPGGIYLVVRSRGLHTTVSC